MLRGMRWTLLLALACHTVDVPPAPEGPAYGLSDGAYTTLQAVWEPLPPSADTLARIDAGELDVTDIDAFDDAGLGVRLADGNPWIEHTELAPDFVEGTDRRSIAWFWQAADPQLIDEESPIRFEAFEALYRPQGHLTTQVFEAHVRSAQRISDLGSRQFDFALLAGDLTDGSQANELGWVIAAMNGGVIDPDSGIDDDPLAGPGNDFNDPFEAEGLAVPWYPAIGNHETQYNGGFGVVDTTLRQASVGSAVYDSGLFANGYRDGAVLTAPVRTEGDVVPDPRRLVLGLQQVLRTLFLAGGQPIGHGLSSADIDAGIGYYSAHPTDGPIRLIVLNTVNTLGGLGLGEAGVLDQVQFDWLNGELADADAANEVVIVMSHHQAADILVTSEVSGDDLVAALTATPGVVLHVTGHGHTNEATVLASSDNGYWELMLASTVDFPMQSRCIELVWEGNGYLSIYATNLGHNSPEQSLAHRGRQLAAAKRVFGSVLSTGDVMAFWDEDVAAQNLLLRVPLSAGVEAALAQHQWPAVIESETTLSTLSAP
jgi:3',5'-cyclic AMP phosphodiesterase CpdA